MEPKFQGIFPVLPAPFDESGAIAYHDLENIVEFAIRNNVQGITVNDFFGEFQYLTDEERRKVTETVLKKANGRVPVIVGVSAVTPMKTVELALHAQENGAAAVLCSIPFLSAYPWGKIVELGFKPMNAVLHIPIMLNNAPDFGGPIGVSQQEQLLRELNNVSYVKDDSAAIHTAITDTLNMAGGLPESCFAGVFAGIGGYDMVHEYKRGACGFMPGVHLSDLMELIWKALELKEYEKAEKIQFALSRLHLLERLFPNDVCKYVLKERGVIANVGCRITGKPHFDAANVGELRRILSSLSTEAELR